MISSGRLVRRLVFHAYETQISQTKPKHRGRCMGPSSYVSYKSVFPLYFGGVESKRNTVRGTSAALEMLPRLPLLLLQLNQTCPTWKDAARRSGHRLTSTAFKITSRHPVHSNGLV